MWICPAMLLCSNPPRVSEVPHRRQKDEENLKSVRMTINNYQLSLPTPKQIEHVIYLSHAWPENHDFVWIIFLLQELSVLILKPIKLVYWGSSLGYVSLILNQLLLYIVSQPGDQKSLKKYTKKTNKQYKYI